MLYGLPPNSKFNNLHNIKTNNTQKKKKKKLNLLSPRTFSHYPLKMGDHVFIGPSSIIEAALIGSHVHISENCVIGKFAIIKDFVTVLPGTIVPAQMVIPSFSVVGGRPARVVGEVPEGGHEAFDCRDRYRAIGNS